MKKLMITVLCAGLAASAWAGVNPANPGLPDVTDAAFGATISANQMSAMCVDCHTLAPKPAMGTHFVSTAAGVTNSGGSGNVGTRDGGQYFRVTEWTNNAAAGDGAVNYSKFGDGTTSYIPALPTGRTLAMTATATGVDATMEIICESCHSIIINDAGGNNLLVNNVAGGVNDWQTAVTESSLCVGCHGFMYTSVDTYGAWTASQANNPNASDARQTSALASGPRGNNEQHTIQSTGNTYPMNHHVGTNDSINDSAAAAAPNNMVATGALWTDNLVISYDDDPIDNTSTLGGMPQRGTWDAAFTKPSATNVLTCTNCHAPGHGGGISEGASILRNGISRTARANAWSRITEDADGFKRINDSTFCGGCHVLP